MHYIFNGLPAGSPAHTVMLSLIATAIGILLLIAFILARRAVRNRYFRKRDRRVEFIRDNWQKIVSGQISAEEWFSLKIDRDIVEDILLNRINNAETDEMQALQELARSSGLLDQRIRQARRGRGWSRRLALSALGRMKIMESIPALSEALEDPCDETVVEAIRGLGQVGTKEAGQHIVMHLSEKSFQCPSKIAEQALAQCFKSAPQLLLNEVLRSDDDLRPILARALAEVADDRLFGNIRKLACDRLAEVRASAARIIASVKPSYASYILPLLTGDSEWFVRLRAAVAIGALGHNSGIPLLISLLCDSNRFVRLRAASELVRFRGEEVRIVQSVMDTKDRYAIQAFISELERSGRLTEMINGMVADIPESSTEPVLMTVLQNGFRNIVIDLILTHTNERVRDRIARTIVKSKDVSLIEDLKHFCTTDLNPEQMDLLNWVISELESVKVENSLVMEVASL